MQKLLFPMAQREIKLSHCSVQLIESCGENKPEVIQYCNSTKGGRDDMGQKVGY